ncbi:MAG: tagaturonate reductase [Oscillospiraceae bacterium]
MKQLSYSALEETGYKGYLLKEAPERVLQFGEGNFLRAFVDYFVDVANEKCGFNSKVVVAQPIAQGLAEVINQQQGLYTLYLRGFENGEKVNNKRVISSISRCINPYAEYAALLECAHNPELRFIVSNTTEAGIVYNDNSLFDQEPPITFPAKLTRFLYERFKVFGAEKGKGLVVLSCELIDHNGEELEKCVHQYIEQWNLEEAFAKWVKEENIFCSTLVDRIVTGYPAAEAEELNRQNGYEDKLLDTGEVFGFWVIEGPKSLEEELPFAKAGLPVLITNDHTPYKQRKVRILNGAHTSMVLAAYLAGQDIVRSCMEDETIGSFMNSAIYNEIIPTLTLPKAELEEFAASVADRFKNPFIDHALLAIALNSTSKWRARVLPSVKGYIEKFGKVPPLLTFSFAAYIAFYSGGTRTENGLVCKRGAGEYTVKDDDFVLDFYAAHGGAAAAVLAHEVCANQEMWGEDLSQLPGFEAAVAGYLALIEQKGMKQALAEVVKA